ncbi:MAG TPA: hypothetical protein DCS85_10230, partial [Verrucomicrobiales bacterium]|nr:hypothetical protein [Verrucomicrobiales bacterium]
MADEHPPNPDPKDPRKPSESGGFNWRVLILFAIALGLLTIALSGAGKGKGKPISFSEFKAKLEEGKIVTGVGQYPLEVVTNESSFNAQIVGYLTQEPTIIRRSGETPRSFRVRINLNLDGPKLTRLLGSRVQSVPPEDVTALEGQDTTFAEFEQWVSGHE